MERVQVHVSPEQRSRWQEEARRRGVALGAMVREIVEGDLDGRMSQRDGIERMASLVGERLEGLLEAHLFAIDQSLHSARGQQPVVAAAPGLPPGYVPVGPPRPTSFERQCENFDLHEVGVVCSICGGSIS